MSQAIDSPPVKPSRIPLLAGLLLAVALGGGGFYGAYSGRVPLGAGLQRAPGGAVAPAQAGSFVPVDPVTVNLGQRGQARHLRFVAQLEVPPEHVAEVTRLMPRIVDVLNTYLRALDLPELESAAILPRLRGQMLRRIQIVTGPGRVNDLLIMEFVFN